jgi:hypothetical protein
MVSVKRRIKIFLEYVKYNVCVRVCGTNIKKDRSQISCLKNEYIFRHIFRIFIVMAYVN